MKKRSQTVSAVLFFIFLATFGIAMFFLPEKRFSETENRSLAAFPELSSDSVKSGEFTGGFEDYFADHFPMRTQWVSLKTKAELFSGKTLLNDVFFAEEALIEQFQRPDRELAEKNAAAVNSFASSCSIPVYMMIAPTSAGLYEDTLPDDAPYYNQKSFIDFFYSMLSDSVTKLDVYSSLYSMRDEYIYYRNDHHWTSLGAFTAYSAAIGRMGFTPMGYSSYDIEHVSADFRGTLYSKVLSEKYPADVIDIYHCSEGSKVVSVDINDGREVKSFSGMYFREYLDKKDKYSMYLGENVPLLTIKTDLPNEKKLLVIKDSYANCFIPFLTQHYSEISVVDMRKLDSLSYVLDEYIDFKDYIQVLILYNAGTLSSDEDLKKITR